MSNDTIFRILCEIYARQEGLQIDAIWREPRETAKNKKETRP